MNATLDPTTIGLFLLIVFPGLVSTTIYRLIMPARALDWGNALLQGLFYSAVNFVLGWPLALGTIFKSKGIARRIHTPYPTVWDAFFDQREPLFLLAHLNNGKVIGGYWADKSFAGSFPNDGDVYLESVYAVDASGKFGDPIRNTRGALLRKDQYSYIELFAAPQPEATHNGDGQQRQ